MNAHDHEHADHRHAHAPASFGRAFALGIGLNVAFVGIEAAAGFAAGSMALLADAGHNLSDVLGLVVAWGGSVLAQRPPSRRYTYGLKRSSILAALANAMLLLIAVGAIALEAVQRLSAPEPVAGGMVMAVAAAGVAVNGVTAWLFASGGERDINIRGAFLHMAADAAISAGVVVAGLIVLVTGWNAIDPMVSLVVSAIIVWGTWGLLKDSLALSLDAVPSGVKEADVRAYLAGLDGVAGLHDLHIWAMGTTDTALTAHLVMPGGHPGDAFLLETAHALDHRFGIGHATLQVETSADTACRLAPDSVV